jgi:hypothetical protein
MERTSTQDEAGALTRKPLLGHPANGKECVPNEALGTERAEMPSESNRCARRRERLEEHAEKICFNALPLIEHLAPRVAIAAGQGIERLHRGLEIGRQLRAPAIGKRVGEDRRRLTPDEPVLLKAQITKRRRRASKRVERAEQIVSKSRQCELTGAHGAAWLRRRLANRHRPAGVRQVIRRNEPVRPRTDHHRVRHRAARFFARAAGTHDVAP